jgi:hypothetical protein
MKTLSILTKQRHTSQSALLIAFLLLKCLLCPLVGIYLNVCKQYVSVQRVETVKTNFDRVLKPMESVWCLHETCRYMHQPFIIRQGAKRLQQPKDVIDWYSDLITTTSIGYPSEAYTIDDNEDKVAMYLSFDPVLSL